jgi:hypothetical protein
MRLTVIGTGYLGLTQAACLADLGHEVLAIDPDRDKVVKTAIAEEPLFEPDLRSLLARNLDNGRLRFANSFAEAAEFGDAHFLCMGPSKVPHGVTDPREVYAVTDALAPHLTSRCLIVGKCMTPVGTARNVMRRIRAAAPAGDQVDLAWNPAFLRAGSAVQGTLSPQLLVFGVTSEWSEILLRRIYGLNRESGTPGLVMDPETAEMIKISTGEGGSEPAHASAEERIEAPAKGRLPPGPAYNCRAISATLRHQRAVLQSPVETSPPRPDRTLMPEHAAFGPNPRLVRKAELTILMPCLNEAETVAICVRKARTFLAAHQINGEVLVADNGSTDGSQQLASEAGARVVGVSERGYGNALLSGIMEARGQYVIMGDADDSYDFTALMPFVDRLRAGADLVMGNRFKGGIARGAMPVLHRYLGNPALSFIGRLFFRSKISDFHCGLRGFRRDGILSLGLQASGMEFASEMIVKATLAGQLVEEVPTTLSPDGRSRPPHLRSWRDGWRHLRFLLLFSPRWLFLIPGAALLALGMGVGTAAVVAPSTLSAMTGNTDTLAFASAMVVTGLQSILFGLFAYIYASKEGFLPQGRLINRLLAVWNLERVLLAGGVLALAGVAGLAISIVEWHGGRFSHHGHGALRLAVSSATALILSCQIVFSSFFLSILGIRRTRNAEVPGAGYGGGVVASKVVTPTNASGRLAEPIDELGFAD